MQAGHLLFAPLLACLLLGLQLLPCSASEDAGEDSGVRIAYFKTHKTGSSTFGGILARAAASQRLRVYPTWGHYLDPTFVLDSIKPNIVLQHVLKKDKRLRNKASVGSSGGGSEGGSSAASLAGMSNNGEGSGSGSNNASVSSLAEGGQGGSGSKKRQLRPEAAWFTGRVLSFYERSLGPGYELFTTVREPVSLWLSSYFYFWEPFAKASLEHAVETKIGPNPLARDFGLHRYDETLAFLRDEAVRKIRFIPTERMDFVLAYFAEAYRWSIADVLYVSVNANDGARPRWRGDTVIAKRPPSVSELSNATLERIQEMNALDMMLYGAALVRYTSWEEEALRNHPGLPATLQRLQCLRALLPRCGPLAGSSGITGGSGAGSRHGRYSRSGASWSRASSGNRRRRHRHRRRRLFQEQQPQQPQQEAASADDGSGTLSAEVSGTISTISAADAATDYYEPLCAWLGMEDLSYESLYLNDKGSADLASFIVDTNVTVADGIAAVSRFVSEHSAQCSEPEEEEQQQQGQEQGLGQQQEQQQQAAATANRR